MSKIKSQAESVKWSTANVTFKGSNVQENSVSTQEICLNSTVDNRDVVLFPTQVNFDTAMKVCRLHQHLYGKQKFTVYFNQHYVTFNQPQTLLNLAICQTVCKKNFYNDLLIYSIFITPISQKYLCCLHAFEIVWFKQYFKSFEVSNQYDKKGMDGRRKKRL